VAVEVRYYTDPACSWSWSNEPTVRRLMTEFDGALSWTYVMGGLARDYREGHEDPEAGIGGTHGVYPGLVRHWLNVTDRSRMPLDPRLWTEGPIASTYPACMAVKAAQEQAKDGGYRYLRALREGLLCFRRKLDTTEALVDEARATPGLDVDRFRIDLASNAIVELFGADLERLRSRELSVPALALGDRLLQGFFGWTELRDAALASGAEPAIDSPPTVEDALRRFGTLAAPEVAAVCSLPGPRAPAELWSLAAEWRAREDRGLFSPA
jgi:putative protein-disulfide isomerase